MGTPAAAKGSPLVWRAALPCAIAVVQASVLEPRPLCPAKKMINSPLGAAGGTYWNGCLAFVLDAYQKGADVNLRQSLAVEIGPNTYPVDIWPVGASAGHFTPGSGTTGTGNDPPAGALVFWDSTGGGDPVKARDDSHVAISVGDGTLISTNVVGYNGIHEETMAQFAHNSWNLYQGWWLPGTN